MVAFRSSSPDLGPGDTRFVNNVFFFDRPSGFVGLVSQDPTGAARNNSSDFPAVSGDGSAVSLTAPGVTLTTTDNKTFTLSGLTALPSADGTYTLTLTAAGSGIRSRLTNLAVPDNANVSVRVDTTPPAVVSVTPTVDRTTAATADFVVVVSEPVSGVDASDFALTADGLLGAAVVGMTANGERSA